VSASTLNEGETARQSGGLWHDVNMVKRSSRIAKRHEIENRLTAVEKALRSSQAKKEYDEAAARRRAAAGKAKEESQPRTATKKSNSQAR
jgi:hypothetical protein